MFANVDYELEMEGAPPMAGSSSVPGGERLNYIFQTYVTKSLPDSEAGFIARVGYARQHIDVI